MTKNENQYLLHHAKKLTAIHSLGGKCSVCGTSEYSSLEFHHIDPETKLDNLHSMWALRWSDIEEEVQKCILLCGNCHTELHCKNNRNAMASRDLLAELRVTSCSDCGYSGKNMASLSFHHLDPSTKKFTICSATCRKISVTRQELMDEVAKCVVLCRNCHAKRHFNSSRFENAKSEIIARQLEYKETRKPMELSMIQGMLDGGMDRLDICKKLGANRSSLFGYFKKLGLTRPQYISPILTKKCEKCGLQFSTKDQDRKFCGVRCSNFKGKFKKSLPPKPELQKLLETSSLREVGKMFGVSYVTIFKRSR